MSQGIDPIRHDELRVETQPPEASQRPGRRGFALISALLALVVVGGLLVGGYAASESETKISDAERYAALALFAAERGLAKGISLTTIGTLKLIAKDSTRLVLEETIPGSTPLNSYRVTVRRLGDELFLFESTGRIDRGLRGVATRKVGLLGRSRMMGGDFDQALMILGSINLKGNVKVSGRDTLPDNWTDCDNLGVKPAIVAKDTTRITTDGNPKLIGDPPKEQDATMTWDDFTIFGDLTYDELAAAAQIKFKNLATTSVTGIAPITTASGKCDTSTRFNWGDPLDPAGACHFYFPIIHVKGNLDYGGNSIGQGILLVDGNLDLSGTARFYGIVVVKGNMNVGSGTAQIIGSTLIGSTGDMTNLTYLSGTPTIQYSTCSIERAKEYNSFLGTASPVAGRSWLDYTAITY